MIDWAADRGREAARWGVSLVVVLGLHAAALTAWLDRRPDPAETGDVLPSVLVDMAPPAASPVQGPAEAPPAPPVPDSTAPDPARDHPPEPILPQPAPDRMATAAAPPPERTQPEAADPVPVPRRPEVADVADVARPKPAPLPRPRSSPTVTATRVAETRRPATRPPAVKPPATRSGERRDENRPAARASGATQAAPSPSASSGSWAASRASWQGALVAHLRRALQPQNGDTGAAAVRFSVNRAGRVLSATLVGSAGSPALDREAVAVFRRAQPLPAPPPDVAGDTFSFTVPIRFTAR